ncbi:hypothetical protein [Burkholderia diffusa]|uniref:hypothetical protein n=1 Tax=Burkholderia diffusa TaxID=488732 RepID=UPI00158F1E63|nr:hypothetical protein [Burkholderia diffusa]
MTRRPHRPGPRVFELVVFALQRQLLVREDALDADERVLHQIGLRCDRAEAVETGEGGHEHAVDCAERMRDEPILGIGSAARAKGA